MSEAFLDAIDASLLRGVVVQAIGECPSKAIRSRAALFVALPSEILRTCATCCGTKGTFRARPLSPVSFPCFVLGSSYFESRPISQQFSSQDLTKLEYAGNLLWGEDGRSY